MCPVLSVLLYRKNAIFYFGKETMTAFAVASDGLREDERLSRSAVQGLSREWPDREGPMLIEAPMTMLGSRKNIVAPQKG